MGKRHEHIQRWIDAYQSGKGGIHPHWIAQDVAVEFRISRKAAMEYVLEHIRRVSAEAENRERRRYDADTGF